MNRAKSRLCPNPARVHWLSPTTRLSQFRYRNRSPRVTPLPLRFQTNSTHWIPRGQFSLKETPRVHCRASTPTTRRIPKADCSWKLKCCESTPLRRVGRLPWQRSAGTHSCTDTQTCLLYTSDAADEEDSVD